MSFRRTPGFHEAPRQTVERISAKTSIRGRYRSSGVSRVYRLSLLGVAASRARAAGEGDRGIASRRGAQAQPRRWLARPGRSALPLA